METKEVVAGVGGFVGGTLTGAVATYLATKPSEALGDIQAIADVTKISRMWEGSTMWLEKKLLLAGKDEKGNDNAVYAFVVPGTQNPECFLTVTKYPGYYGFEVCRCGAAAMTVYYQETQVTSWGEETGPLKLGYFSMGLSY